MFADDTTLSTKFTTNNVSIQQEINNELTKITDYLYHNKLTLNVDKTNFIVFRNKNSTIQNIQLSIDGQNLNKVNSCKYLGLIIDDNLTFNKHITNISSKISFRLGLITKLKKEKVPNNILNILYNSLILPHMNYCSNIWSFSNNNNIKRLQKLQNKFRIITNNNTILSVSSITLLNNLTFYINSICNNNNYFHSKYITEIITQGRKIYSLRLQHIHKSIRLNTIFELGKINYNNFIQQHKINPNCISKNKLRILIKNREIN